MRRIALALPLAMALTAPVGAQGGRLVLGGDPTFTRCAPQVSGRFVAFVAPAGELVLLSGVPFPGGRQIGTLSPEADGGTAVTVPGVGTVWLSGDGPVWALVDRTLAADGRSACLAFDKERFTWTSDLLTYVHWMVRDILWQLTETPGRALTIEDRLVTLEVTGPGLRPVEIRGVEGGAIGLAVPGTETRWLFIPLVLSSGRVVVKVVDPTGALFDAAAATDRALVEVGPDVAVPIGTSPPLSLRLVAIAE